MSNRNKRRNKRPPQKVASAKSKSNSDPSSTTLRVQHTEQTFAGPVPPPQALAMYQTLIPDAPERILAMAEKEQNHRITTESKALEASIKFTELSAPGKSFRKTTGLFLAALIVLVMLGTVVFCVHEGATKTASIIAGGMTFIAGIFIAPRLMKLYKKNKKEDK